MSDDDEHPGAEDAPPAEPSEVALAAVDEAKIAEAVESFGGADLKLVIALQKAELDRLLKENAQLHARIEQLVALQEREQILRQQMQSLLGAARNGPKLIGDDRNAANRLTDANRRSARLKEALNLLLDALERRQQS